MNQELTKELAKKLMEIKGETRGSILKTDLQCILREKGEEGLKKVEEELEKLGYPIKYKEINTFDFYPVGLRALFLLAIKKVFNFDDEKVKEMGIKAAKFSLILKFLGKYIFFKKVIFQQSSKIWRENYTFGEMNPIELNMEKKYIIFKLEKFEVHPIVCKYMEGYFIGIFQTLIKSPEIVCQETKCTFKGNEYHEFIVKWK